MNTQTPYTNTHIHMHTRNFTCTHARRHLPAWVHQNIRPNDMTSSQHATGPCDTSILLLTLIGRIVCVRVCVYTYMHVHVHLHTHIYVYACFHLLKFNLPQTLASRCPWEPWIVRKVLCCSLRANYGQKASRSNGVNFPFLTLIFPDQYKPLNLRMIRAVMRETWEIPYRFAGHKRKKRWTDRQRRTWHIAEAWTCIYTHGNTQRRYNNPTPSAAVQSACTFRFLSNPNLFHFHGIKTISVFLGCTQQHQSKPFTCAVWLHIRLQKQHTVQVCVHVGASY